MKELWQTLKPFLLIFIVVVIASFFWIIMKGYNLYYTTLHNVPLQQQINKIRSQNNYVSIGEIPKDLKNAILAVEDHRFYQHCGIDFISIVRAFIKDIWSLSFKEGGSTITQQLAKNLYLSNEKKLERKVAEIFIAFQLEQKYSKDEIFEIYLNTIYFGNGCYGVYDAAINYFGKFVSELNSYEAILMASFPKAPSIYSNKDYLILAQKRQEYIISKMIKYGYLEKEDRNKIFQLKTE